MSDSVVPTFSMAERDRRWDLARSFMVREGLDALLVFGEHEDAGPAPAGAGAYPPEGDRPTMSADMALEPNYAYGRHLAYLGGTVIVGDDDPVELNPYTAGILRAAGP